MLGEDIRRRFNYDPETGVFSQRHGPRAGKPMLGTNSEGYVLIRMGGKKYKAHRLAWLYVYGSWPTGQIDHRDNDRSNNQISNLREVTNSQNAMNRRARSGIKGVNWNKANQKWRAFIGIDGQQVYLGSYNTQEEAAAAYKAAGEILHGEFARVA